jgi:hypothetical protein
VSVAMIAGFALALIGAGLFLAQLWLQPFLPETFFKLIVTDGVLLAIAVAAGFFLKERREAERLNKNRDLG